MKNLFNSKKGMMVLVYIIMGLVVIGVMIPVISYIKKTSDTQLIKDYGINRDDGFVPWDYEDRLTVEERIAKKSFELLVKAINALSEGDEDIKTSSYLENGRSIKVYYYAKFEAEKYGTNTHVDSECLQTISKYGSQTINCKNVFDAYGSPASLVDQTPYDIDAVYSFKVDTGQEVCGVENGNQFAGADLKTWNPSSDEGCSDSPSYIVCGGYKVYYCGKNAWSIKTLVEKTSQPDFVSLNQRNTFGARISDTISSSFNIVTRAFGASPDQVSQAYCYDGVLYNITNKTQMCLSCDINSENGRCSFEGFELPQKITELEAESWISGYGDPKYVMYYEQFPQGEEQSWQISEVTILSAALTVGSIAFDFLPLAGKVLKNKLLLSKVLTPLKNLYAKAKRGVYDNTIGPTVNNIKNGLGSLFGKSTDEVVEIALRQAALNAKTPGIDDVAREINKRVVKESLESSLVGASITSSDEIATLSDDIINNLGDYFDDTGKPFDEFFEKFSDDVSEEFRRKILDNPQRYFPDGLTTGQIDEVASSLKSQVDEVIKQIDYVNKIKVIAFEMSLSNKEKFFMQSLRSLFNEERVGNTVLHNLDQSVFDDVAKQVDGILEGLSPEGKEKLFKEAEEMARKFISSSGELNYAKTLGVSIDENQEIYSQITKQIDSLISDAKYQTLFGKIEAGSKGIWNIKGRLLFGGVIAAHAAHMDRVNEKYTPAGINTLSLSEVSIFELRKTETLSNEAQNLFIRLDKGGRDFKFTNRFFMASPCKTDLDIRREVCTCAVESVVQKINGKWTGYILETDKGQVPVKNVDVKTNDYNLKNFEFVTNMDITDLTMGAYFANDVNVIDGQYVIEYPVLNQGAGISNAVKECKTRGWWDSNIFTFSNIDVKTECISIAESNTAYTKYREYNDGFNYCYAGENLEADALKGAILITQVGVSIAFGVPSVGLGTVLVSPIVNILGIVAESYIDEGSKWPRREYDGSVGAEYLLAAGGP